MRCPREDGHLHRGRCETGLIGTPHQRGRRRARLLLLWNTRSRRLLSQRSTGKSDGCWRSGSVHPTGTATMLSIARTRVSTPTFVDAETSNGETRNAPTRASSVSSERRNPR